MGAYAGPNINENGLVLALDGANYRSFKGEATTNYYSTPETLTSGRTGSTDGTIKTDYTSGGPTGGRFTRVVRDTSVTRSTDWEWQIVYSNTGLSLTNPFVVSFYARCPNGTLGSIELSNPDVEGQTFNIDSTWRRFTASFTYGAQSGLTFFRFNRGYSTFSSVNGATYDLANIQIEAKSYSTTFTTGTRGTTVATGGGWADLTGNGNNGQLVNDVRESADNLGSLSFDGVDDRVDVVNPGIHQTFSVLSWIKCTNVASSNNIVSKNGPYFMRIVGSKLRFNVLTSTGWLFQVGNATLSNNVWYHLAMVYDGSTWKGYINSNLDFSVSKTGTISSNAALYIGYTPAAGEQAGFNGNIAQVKIYNRALTATEVQQNYEALRGRFEI